MIITFLQRVGWFVGLTLLQVLILNHVQIGGYATPFLYIYFILMLNSDTSRNEQLLWAFFLGLTIDIFFRHGRYERDGLRVAGLSSSFFAEAVYPARHAGEL